jgi:alpha-beta hydrolase superfamily lysophospholipase
MPDENPRAIILLVHGLGEHILRYNQWASFFNAENIGIIGIDVRGHGKSNGKKGKAHYCDFLKDLNTLIDYSCKKYPFIPKILYGHDLGGSIVLNYAIKNKSNVAGIVSASPWIRNFYTPSYMSKLRAKFMNKFYPLFTISNSLKDSNLSHDWSIIRTYKDDPLVHNRMSVCLYDEARDAGNCILHNKHKINVPMLIMHGTGDPITSWRASNTFAKHTGNSTKIKLWKDAYHELHNEFEKEEIFNYVLAWINSLPSVQ